MSIQKKLEEKIEHFKSLELAKNHLTKLEIRISAIHNKLNQLRIILEKEYKDVEILEKTSVRAIFEKILGDKESQLEKERQEYLTAALNYDECAASLELLDFERKILQKKIASFDIIKSELYSLIRQREASLSIEDPLAKQLITDINIKIDDCISLKRELHEAIFVGLKIKKKLDEITLNLNQVERWGEYALNRPDTHIKKMVYINKAKTDAYKVKQLLQEFEDELSDIYDDQHIYIKSSHQVFKHFIDSLFDNLISDWIVLMKIKNSKYTVSQVRDKVIRITQSLQHDLKQTELAMEELINKKEKIILELN